MPVFAYKGYNAQGRTVSGTKDAENDRTIEQVLRKDGVFVTELRETGSSTEDTPGKKFDIKCLRRAGLRAGRWPSLPGNWRRWSAPAFRWSRRWARCVDQVEHEHSSSVWSDVKQRVNEGAALADALGQHPKIFSGLFVNMVKAGETSGALDVVLTRLADFTESQAGCARRSSAPCPTRS